MSVRRQTDKGLPKYGDTDTFINERGEELVRVEGVATDAAQVFRLKNEGSFEKYEYHRDTDSWVCWDKSGRRTFLGQREDGQASARIRRLGTSDTYAWHIAEAVDTNGNRIRFGYEMDGAQIYLKRIEYGALERNDPESVQAIDFVWESRPDPFVDYRPTFRLVTAKRLRSVSMSSASRLVRRYDLSYAPASDRPISTLVQVRYVGSDGLSSLPPVDLEYTRSVAPASGTLRGIAGAGAARLARSGETPDEGAAEVLDFNADGLPDIYVTRNSFSPTGQYDVFYENIGNDTYVQRQLTQSASLGLPLQSTSSFLRDVDGNGTVDLVAELGQGTRNFVYRGNLGGQWAAANATITLPSGASAQEVFLDSEIRAVDLDFDKRIDTLRAVATTDLSGSGIAFASYRNNGDGTITALGMSPIVRGLPPSATFAQSNGRLLLADMNGDRMQDLVFLRDASNGGPLWWPAMGFGRFDDSTNGYTFASPPNFSGDDPRLDAAEVQDLNGDGLADIFEINGAAVRYWLNLDGTRFGAPGTVNIGKQFDQQYATWRLADVDGNGLEDILFSVSSQPTPDYLPTGLHRFALFGPVPPNLLSSATNGIGRTSRVSYRSHIVDLIRDRAAGKNWDTPPPFPVTVVDAVEETDGLDTYRSEFTYSGGYYDGIEKEFRGFASAIRRDLGDSSAPTSVNEFAFDTGRTAEARKGLLLSQETRAEDGSVFLRDTITWNTRVLFSPVVGRDTRAVVFPFRTALVQDILEQGRGEPKQIETQSRFDDYGNEILRAEFGIVEGANRSVANDERITVSTFTASNASGRAKWILDKPVRIEIRDETDVVLNADSFSITGSRGIVERKVNYYDDEDFSGSNEGVVTRGNLTMVRDWIDPSQPAGFATTLRQRFDPFGNPVLMMDALAQLSSGSPDSTKGHFRAVGYDSAFATFPVEETIHVGAGSAPLVVAATWDAGFGVVTGSTDFNGFKTGYDYDVFARPAAVHKPDDPAGWPTTIYQFGLAIPSPTGRLVNYIEILSRDKDAGTTPGDRSRYHISRKYIDGLGRDLMAKQEASEDGQVRVAVSGATDFNRRKGAATVLQPFFTRGTGTLDQQLGFEDIRDAGWSGDFHENGSLVTLNLANAHQTRATYDAMLRPAESTNPDATHSKMVYEPLATLTFDENDSDPVSSHADTPTVHRKDGLGRLVEVDEFVRLDDDGNPVSDLRSWNTRYQYRVDDPLTEILDARNNRKVMEYDGLKRMTLMNDPNRGILRNTYNAINLIERVDAKNQRTTYTHDGVNRLLTEDYHDEGLPFSANRAYNPSLPTSSSNQPDVQYIYDSAEQDIDLGDGTRGPARNAKGMLARVIDLAGEEVYSYDERGREEWTVRAIPDPELGVLSAFQTQFGRDSLDRLTYVIYPDGDRAAMEYNDRTLLERIVGGATANLGGTPYAVGAIDYLPSGQIGRLLTGDGMVNTRKYDRRLRMTDLRIAGTSELLHYGYTFDNASNITRIDDLRPTAVEPLGLPMRNTQLFGYDDRYRLIGAQYSFNAPGEAFRDDGRIAYRYNSIGNMVSQTSTIDDRDDSGKSITNLGTRLHGGTAGDQGRSGRAAGDPPGPHALTSADNGTDRHDLPYDDNGNMTNIDGLALTWDFEDRLAAAENDKMQAQYRYDYTGRRVVKHVIGKADNPSLDTLYINRWFEVREHEQPVKYLWNGETRVARATGTLDAAQPRVQRWRLREGWNMISVAIDAPDLAAQLGIGTPRVRAAFRWRSGTMDYVPVTTASALPQGTVLRLDMAEAAVVSARGTYTRVDQRAITAPGDYVGAPTLEGFPVGNALLAEVTNVWVPKDGDWQLAKSGNVLAPGDVLHARATDDTALFLPSTASQIVYYHQDHLGSSDAVTDGEGVLLERTLQYPYGHPRASQSLIVGTGLLEAKYGFTQKERDSESDLRYFEARYYATDLGVFVGVDPIGKGSIDRELLNPRYCSSYAYCHGQPFTNVDHDGRFPKRIDSDLQFTRTKSEGWEAHVLMRDGSVESFPLPSSTNATLEAIRWDSKDFHAYDKSLEAPIGCTDSELTGLLVNKPTPGAGSLPATVLGQSNNANPSLWLSWYEAPVTSYTITSNTGKIAVLNVTEQKHPLRPGVVMRLTDNTTGNPNIVRNLGVGSGRLQSEVSWKGVFRDRINDQWIGETTSLFKACQ